ncbi:Gp19/Gp15/Gp42 family protein [Collinsella bouchesdurhonensis]|uniref:Gp19/Gp15/Gp42 family protein n=1 Tax=Collinsella bouchesdurhonensis TaxID=1907654 RepID=UPI0034A331D3
MEALASVEDYTARYGEPADSGRATALLDDASALLLSAYEGFWGEDYAEGAHAAFDRSACAVCCMVVNRVLSAPAAMLGATQYSQGAGGYTASVSYGSALGEMYLGKSDLKRLGLDVQRMRVLTPIERGEVTE